MKKTASFILTLSLLISALSNGSPISKAETDLPTIYVSIVSHNEEPNGTTHPDFTEDYDSYLEYRDGAVEFAELVHEYGAEYDFQSDWNYLLAEADYGESFSNTNGKNLLEWLVEDMDFSVDPHAHESVYSIADVAYLMEQLGITPSNIVGGFIASPADESRVEDFQVPIEGWVYNTSWEADALWGAATGMHADDSVVEISGIWRAKNNENFSTHDEDSKPVIGGYTSDWDGLDDLLEKRADGDLDPDQMYTVTIMNNQEDFSDQSFLDEFEAELEAHEDETNSGAIAWVTLPEALEIWENDFNESPSLYSYEEGNLSPESSGTSSSNSSSSAFSDVDSGDAYADAINYVYEENIVDGYDDGTYRSENSINRAEFTKILIESYYPGEASQSENCFSDVAAGEWYAKYICLAKVRLIVSGYDDGSFKPAQAVNIAEALKITFETYFNVPDVSGEWYQKYWDYAEDHNYLLDDWDSPAQELSRGEMAELIYRIKTGNESTVSTATSSENETLTTNNVLFTVNTQEFIFVDESVETLNRIIDIHEAYDVPVDIYLDDPILQAYLDEAPELIERFIDSPMVSISYHARPPVPYYYEYEWMDFESMTDSEIEAVIEDYGTHAIDTETGETKTESGGFTYFEEVFGYAPVAASTPTSGTTGSFVKSYFADNGASFLVENDRDYSWGDTKDGIPVRPEDVEVKLFERTDESAESIFDELDSLTGSGPYFMNIKVHDNDFITDDSAWNAIYLTNKKQNGNVLTPPFDLSLAEDRNFLSESESEALWSAYEACVEYASEHSDDYSLWNMRTLANEL